MTLSHYCSNEAFLKIIQTEKLRLSDLSFSNDSMEGRLVGNLVAMVKEENPTLRTLSSLSQELVDLVPDRARALGFCMSTPANALSQWRGYGDRGAGVSIGFNVDALTSLIESQQEPMRRLSCPLITEPRIL